MIKIWNQVVEEGVAFPQEECLTQETGEQFFAEQTYCGVAVDVETNLKLTKTADVFPIADVLRPTEEGIAQEPDNDKIAEIASVWFDVR